MSIDSIDPHDQSTRNVIMDLKGIGFWEAVSEVPPCMTNATSWPIRKFWEHMKSYAFQQAPWLFLWHKPWPSQDPKMKTVF